MWAVTPALPAGLSFSTSTGNITGKLTTALAPSNFMVTASNAGGTSSVTLTLSANALLLSLGGGCIGSVAISSTVVLSEDNCGIQQWVLWNYASGQLLAQGEACPVKTCIDQGVGAAVNTQIAGQIAVVPYIAPVFTGKIQAPGSPVAVGFQIRSIADGSVRATVSFGGTPWQLASDGSYVCAATAAGIGTIPQGLVAWGPDGSVIMTHAGNYTHARLSCVPGLIRVAMGPAGANVIETITVPSGTSSLSPAFAGTFNSWFLDGSAFLSNVGTTVWVYSPAAVQEDFRTLPTAAGLAGSGPWFWTADGTTLSIYKVGSSATPAATYPAATLPPPFSSVRPSGPTIAIPGASAGSLQIIDLSGNTPTVTNHSIPLNAANPASPPNITAYAATSASNWVVGDSNGALLDGASLATTPRYFGYGEVPSLAGAQTRLAVATSIGKVLIFNTSDFSLASTLDYAASQLAISADGSVLAIRGSIAPTPSGSSAVSVFTVSLPTGTVINTWAGDGATDISLSNSGALLGQVLSGLTSTSRQVTASTGGPVLWSDTVSELFPIEFSLDDTLIAATSGTQDTTPTTTIYLNFVKSSAVPGSAVGWLPNDFLLQNVRNAGTIFSSTGIPQSGPKLPGLVGPIQVLSADSIYDESGNAIYSLTSGDKIWSSPGNDFSFGTIAGSQVVFVTIDGQLVTEPH